VSDTTKTPKGNGAKHKAPAPASPQKRAVFSFEEDIVVKMPPVKTSSMRVKIGEVKKPKPRPVIEQEQAE